MDQPAEKPDPLNGLQVFRLRLALRALQHPSKKAALAALRQPDVLKDLTPEQLTAHESIVKELNGPRWDRPSPFSTVGGPRGANRTRSIADSRSGPRGPCPTWRMGLRTGRPAGRSRFRPIRARSRFASN
jgi:hypothetical protein